MSREYVKDLMSIFQCDEYYYFHKNNPDILSDIVNLKHTSEMIEADIKINTWIGQFINQGLFKGCNFPGYYEVMTRLYTNLGIQDKLKDIVYYVPSVDYSKFYINNVDTYFGENTKNVLFCNNDVKSGQASNQDLSNVINNLLYKFPNIKFIVTNKNDNIMSRYNLVYASDIINKPDNGFDLNEISYISTKSDIIVGRSSGPYSFSVVKENITSKPMICFTNTIESAWFLNGTERLIWNHNQNENNMINVISNEIEKL
jgi:hypothetical protein